MYYFIEAYDKEDAAFLRDIFGRPESSDISDIEGWVIDKDKLVEVQKACRVIVHEIPEHYQDNIKSFVMDYWDGEFSFDFEKKYVEAN